MTREFLDLRVEGCRVLGGRAVPLRVNGIRGAVACDGTAGLWLPGVVASPLPESERDNFKRLRVIFETRAPWSIVTRFADLYAFARAPGPVRLSGCLRGQIAPGVMINRHLLSRWLPFDFDPSLPCTVQFRGASDPVRIDARVMSLVIMPVHVSKEEKYWEAFGVVPSLFPDEGCVPLDSRSLSFGAAAVPDRGLRDGSAS